MMLQCTTTASPTYNSGLRGHPKPGNPEAALDCSLAMAPGRDRSALVVGWRAGRGAGLGRGVHGLLAERRILTPGYVGRSLKAAQPLLHGIPLFSAQELRPFQAAEGVEIV